MRVLFLFLVGCGGAEKPGDTSNTATSTATGAVGALSGSATWSVEFEDGTESCTYTRTYDGIEDQSQPWLCPQCEVVYRVDVQLEGIACYDQIAGGTDPADVEWLGYGGGAWYRGGAENYLLSEQGSTTISGAEVSYVSSTDWIEDPSVGNFRFDIAGSFTESDGTGDSWHGYAPPDQYACGWPKADPAPYSGDYVMARGATLPDGYFLDTCGESVRLHDFSGDYLVVDISAVDCPPCQDMARQEPAFVADMEAAGLPTHVVTLLAPSLSDVLGVSSLDELEDWEDAYDLHSPVLGDRGWGVFVAGETLGDGFGYPTWMVVAPDLTVIDYGAGFGGWDAIQSIIESDAG